MAKKMKLDSLLTANKKNKGIEKMSQFSDQEKKEASSQAQRQSSKELLANGALKTPEAPENQLQYRPQVSNPATSSEVSLEEPGKRGRKRQYFDPRLKALEMQKISARTKIRLQNLINAKFDGYTPDKMIDFLYDYYLEKGLSRDDRFFLTQVEEATMEEYKEKPKYQKLFKELENDEN